MAQDLSQWHLDRKVPITLIFAIFLQTATAVWWAASIQGRMAQIERENERSTLRSEQIDTAVAEQARSIAVLSETVANTNRYLERLQTEITDTNALLREMMVKGSSN